MEEIKTPSTRAEKKVFFLIVATAWSFEYYM